MTQSANPQPSDSPTADTPWTGHPRAAAHRQTPGPERYTGIFSRETVERYVCGDACPVYPGKQYLDWEIPDPAEQNRDGVRAVVEDIARSLARERRRVLTTKNSTMRVLSMDSFPSANAITIPIIPMAVPRRCTGMTASGAVIRSGSTMPDAEACVIRPSGRSAVSGAGGGRCRPHAEEHQPEAEHREAGQQDRPGKGAGCRDDTRDHGRYRTQQELRCAQQGGRLSSARVGCGHGLSHEGWLAHPEAEHEHDDRAEEGREGCLCEHHDNADY